MTLQKTLDEVGQRTALLEKHSKIEGIGTSSDDETLLKRFIVRGAYRIGIERGIVDTDSTLDETPTDETIDDDILDSVTPELEGALVHWVIAEWLETIPQAAQLAVNERALYESDLKKFRFIPRSESTSTGRVFRAF
jgi:hypothetical protein